MRSRLVSAGLAALIAGGITLGAVAVEAAGERLRVDYESERLSVVADEVGLTEVLIAIGRKVGFTVAESRSPSRPVTVAIEGASVDDVLRQLLRTENHTILYKRGTDPSSVVVDRIVLQGAPSIGGSTVASDASSPNTDSSLVASNRSVAVPVVPSPGAMQPVAAPSGDSVSGEQVTVGDMLKSHALAGLPPTPGQVGGLAGQQASGVAGQPGAAGGAAPGAAPDAGASAVPQSLEETLAITTRRAQQGLSSLVEGLERATRSLQQQPAAPPANR